VCIPATGWSSIQWQQVAPANGQSTSERATAAAGTSSCKLFKSRLHSHQLPMILLTIGTLAQASTVSSFMLISWRPNLVQPEINLWQTHILSHRQQSASTTHKNSFPTGQKTMIPPLQIPEGSCYKNLAIKFLSHFKQSVTIAKTNWLVLFTAIVTQTLCQINPLFQQVAQYHRI